MSWMKLKKLVSHRKMWRVLTNKLSFKLRQSNPHKNRRSHKRRWASLSLRPKRFKKKPNSLKKHRLAAPVFVDHLFVEPVVPAEGNINIPSSVECRGREYSGKEGRSEKDDDAVSADDVWESMVLASPQMQGINQRAEEFIARFRADMRQQEMLARGL